MMPMAVVSTTNHETDNPLVTLLQLWLEAKANSRQERYCCWRSTLTFWIATKKVKA
jgi:hypothetical protein